MYALFTEPVLTRCFWPNLLKFDQNRVFTPGTLTPKLLRFS